MTATPFSFSVPADSLRAALKHVSKDAKRPTLTGVYIDPTGVIVGTNGHTLLACAFGGDREIDGTLPTRAVILRPTGTVPAWATLANVSDVPFNGPEYRTVRVTYTGPRGKSLDALAHELVGPFPTWRNVIPRVYDPALPIPPFDVALLALFGTGQRCPVQLVASGEQAAIRVVMEDDTRYGLMMPLGGTGAGNLPTRAEGATLPAWIDRA